MFLNNYIKTFDKVICIIFEITSLLSPRFSKNLISMIENILKIWNVGKNQEIEKYIKDICNSHKNVLKIMEQDGYILEKVFFEETLRLWWISFKTSNIHQFNEISNIAWTEILLCLIFSKNSKKVQMILSWKNFSWVL